MRLEKLRVRGLVVRDGRGGAHREFTYRLVRADVAEGAPREGRSRADGKSEISSPRCDMGCG